MGEKSFEQSAGFLRIIDGGNPLDASGVHPEAYGLVEKMATDHGKQVGEIIGDSAFLKKVKAQDYVTEQFGLPTIMDILKELDKPGRDPRPEFKTASLKDGIETISDLREDMILEGTVTNVTNFGAFVDIGVHQDGLVHISCLADKFVEDPRTVVKAGQIVKVKVQDVDVKRKRIALTMRLQDAKPVDKSNKRNSKANSRAGQHKQSGANRNAGGNKQHKVNPFAAKLGAALKK
jgi:uncharacterized protein